MKQANTMRHSSARCAAAGLACVLGMSTGLDAWAAAAGRFLFVVGDVRVMPADGGSAVRVRRGAEVQPGDTVITTARGVAQLRMVDGAQLAVRPATQLRIDEYRFEQPEQEDRSFFSLLTGAFRSVTGLIGQRNTSAYQVSTSTATIGIRGSDADIGHDQVTELTAVRTYDGAHVLTARDQTGPAATLVTGPGDIATVLPGQAPTFAAEFPFATAPTPAAGGEAGEGEQADGQQAAAEGDDAAAEGEKPARAAAAGDDTGDREGGKALGPRPPPVRTIISSAGASALDVVRIAPVGSAVAGGFLATDSGGVLEANAGGLVNNPPGTVAVLGPLNEVVLVLDKDSTGAFTFLAGKATLRQFGTFAIPGGPGAIAARGTWGIWQGDFVVVDEGRLPKALGGFPFAFADRATRATEIAALGGTAFTYTRIGGAITNEKGAPPTAYPLHAVGTFGSGPMLGSITIETPSAMTIDFATGSTGWTLSGTGSVRDLIEDNITLTGSCAAPCAPSGETGGRFIGQRAEGLILGIGLADDASGKGIIGSAVLRR